LFGQESLTKNFLTETIKLYLGRLLISKKLFLASILFFVLIDLPLISLVVASSEMWSRTYGGAGEDVAYSLGETSDGGYSIAGATNGNVLLVKTDEQGNLEWNHTYGGGRAYSLVKTSDGGYAIAGYTNSFSSEGTDFWLIKTDEFGNMEWNKTYGRVDAEWIRITGEVRDNAYSLVATSDGGYALTGDTSPHILGSPRDVWLVKIDAYGNMEWNRTYGGESYEDAYSLVATSDGGFAIAGCTRSFGAGFEDFWLIKTDEYGNMEWNRTYGGEEWERARSLIETSDGGFALAGYTDSFGAEGYDFWLVKTDESGVIPEFPSWISLPLLLVATLAAIIYKQRLPKPSSA